MEHALWIGGPPAAGKTTIAMRLARRHGLRLYRADTRTWVHRDRALEAGNTAARRWESLAPPDRWNGPTTDELFEMSLHRERGPMVIDDVRGLPAAPLVIAEGSPLPPSAVSSGIVPRARAVWLLPTAELQQARLDEAGTAQGPARLYRHLREVIERDARDHGVMALPIDDSRTVPEVTAEVERLFGDALSRGPGAETRPDRRALLREMNEATVGQIRGYYARPWAEGDADSVACSFVCECADPGCDTDVLLTVGEVATGRAVAPGHDAHADTRMKT